MSTDRRRFLELLTSGAMGAAFPASIARALSLPANQRTQSIADVEHIVVLMQENRSFDHYFGTLRGVRGFGDPRSVQLRSGKPVWYQPSEDGYVLPFHPTAPSMGLQFLEDLAHDWTTTQAAWNEGRYDAWVPNKGATTMAHLNRSDIPYHYALADAFTICDAYHCSLLGPTDPNRYYLWTGWVGNDGSGGGPVVDNAESGYDWPTFPERLQAAGISWKVYQDVGTGLTAEGSWGSTKDAYIGNYGDNSLLYFHQYQKAATGSPLAQRARTGTNVAAGGGLFDHFREDIQTNRLPQVSWVVAPEAYTEHPNWPANYGAWYVSQLLDALTANPEVWSRTAFFLTYDENDGFFDHVVPPTPPRSRSQGRSTVDTTLDLYPGGAKLPAGPFGFGVRVPLLVISPWSKGGWVNSQVFDHTSLIQFVERRFSRDYPQLREPQITPWRRAVAGDLTSAFDFKTPNAATTMLPSTVSYRPADQQRHPDYKPTPPAIQSMPLQEAGTRPARALPYELHVESKVQFDPGAVTLEFRNTGQAGAVFHVRSAGSTEGPWMYTVAAGERTGDRWSFDRFAPGQFDLAVYGPNGFFRRCQGSTLTQEGSQVEVWTRYVKGGPGLTLEIHNFDSQSSRVQIKDGYRKDVVVRAIPGGESIVQHLDLRWSFGWYDVTIRVDADAVFQRHIAGHVETSAPSVSDPAIG